jgi:diacylglycerol kinase (ATP)
MSEKNKWGFIINPVAGNGYAGNYAEKVRAQISQRNLNADIRFTERRGHAVELADDLARQGCSYIIAVGGDGTANETACGILERKDVTFGIVSAGTGNDFSPVVGFSEHFTDADWDALFELNTARMDVGKCNDHYFLNGMGLGYDAKVASENYNPDGTLKSRRGIYFWHITKNLLLYKEKMFHVEFNEHVREAMTFMTTIAIGRRFGGGYYLTPKAMADDGLFDVCLVEPVTLVERLKLFLKVPTGGHLDHPKVGYYRTDKLFLQFAERVPHHLDGELYFADRFDVSILPKKLNVIYNAKGAHFFELKGTGK